MYHPLLSVAEIRAAEEGVLAQDPFPDATMQKAAKAVADAADWMLQIPALEICAGNYGGAGHANHGVGGTARTKASLPEGGGEGVTAAIAREPRGFTGKGTAQPGDASAPLAPLAPMAPLAIVLAGSGGNGGDALYAASFLDKRGWDTVAIPLGAHLHERALAAAREAGVTVLGDAPAPDADRGAAGSSSRPQAVARPHLQDLTPGGLARVAAVYRHVFLIDGVTGIGGRGPLRANAAKWVAAASEAGIPVLAVDVPSGIDADTGQGHDLHVQASVTVTFGGFRRAHALNADCGFVLQADCGLREACLAQVARAAQAPLPGETAPTAPGTTAGVAAGKTLGMRAVFPPDTPPLPEGFVSLSAGPGSHATGMLSPGFSADAPRTVWPAQPLEPLASANKYTGGVVGIRAGSVEYPGAAVLCTSAAVRATSAMVRFAGGCREAVVSALPEVVAADDVKSAGRVQAWVVGPGGGVEACAEDLRTVLRVGADQAGGVSSAQAQKPGVSPAVAVVVDADAITALAAPGNSDLVSAVRDYPGAVVLTPHHGEFVRLRDAVVALAKKNLGTPETEGLAADLEAHALEAAAAMARALGATVVLKGRNTIVTDGASRVVIDTGCSWAATPGSGDVFSGLVGALLAEWNAGEGERGVEKSVIDPVVEAVRVHSLAADIAAQTAYGYAPTSASRISEAIPAARARLVWCGE